MSLKLIKGKIKVNRGITLIALIVTIIILLILAGITISTLTGNNSLIGKSGEAKNATEVANEKEELEVTVTRLYDRRGNLNSTKVVDGINENIKNLNTVTDTEGNFPVKVEYKNGHKYQVASDGTIMISVNAGDTAPSDSNAVYSSGNYTAIIPAGFTVSNVAGETSIENGLVVRDGSNNEWVWIPVSSTDLAKMYTEDATGWNMLGTSVNTKLRTKELTTQNTFKLGNIEILREMPGNLSYYREPDVLQSYDTDQIYRTQAGFGDLADMATKLKDDYKNMIDSVKENGGFYIGRYELGKDSSNNPQVKAGNVMNNTNWYNLYSACKSFSNGNVESRMVFGCQWDQVCRFINEYGDKVSLDDSRTYGNYNNSTENAATSSGWLGSPVTTGIRNQAWKANNIYDLAGNCYDWTQEAYNVNSRATRGGSIYTDGYYSSVANRADNNTTIASSELSSRPTLYVK